MSSILNTDVKLLVDSKMITSSNQYWVFSWQFTSALCHTPQSTCCTSYESHGSWFMVPGFRAHFQYSGGLELDASLIQQNIDLLQRQRPVDVCHNTVEYYVMIRYDGFYISHFSTIKVLLKIGSEYVYVFSSSWEKYGLLFSLFQERSHCQQTHWWFSMLCDITSHIENVQNE